MPDPGGLKGQMAPGDAHPYLALFGWKKNENCPDQLRSGQFDKGY